MRSLGYTFGPARRAGRLPRRGAPARIENGTTEIAPGKIATVVTYLEMHAPPSRPGRALPEGLTLAPVGADVTRYRVLFRAVGEPWLWFSRLAMPEERLAALLADPNVIALALTDGRRDLGLLEFDFRSPPEAELAFFGLVPDQVGTGAGRGLMTEALRLAFARPIRRLSVHTCTLDHPAALSFYIRSGFTPYKRAVEVADDPRLLGQMPPTAAGHHPVLRP